MIDSPITFDEFREANLARVERWHPGFPADGWTGSDWSNAMGGEAGEAMNVVKKLRRQDTGTRGAVDPDRAELVEKLGKELGDIIAYADLLAAYYGIDLGWAAVNKFNEISEREGFPERIRPNPTTPIRYTWESVPIGHSVPGSGIVVEKIPHVGGYHIVLQRDEGMFAGEIWTTYRRGDLPVPVELTEHGLVF